MRGLGKENEMDLITVKYAACLLAGVLISSVSQVLLKKSAMKQYDSLLQQYLNPYVAVAYTMFFASSLLTIFAYRKLPLSMGPVLEATSYIYVTVFGVTIFKEKMGMRNYLALALILAGIFVYARWG